MTDEMYLDAIEQYGDEFDARMGAEAVREMLNDDRSAARSAARSVKI